MISTDRGQNQNQQGTAMSSVTAMTRSSVWTDKAATLATSLWDQGYSASKVADELWDRLGIRVSRSAVIGKLSRIRDGVGQRLTWTDDLVQAMADCASRGLTISEAAQAITRIAGQRVSATAVHCKAATCGIRLGGRGKRTIQPRTPKHLRRTKPLPTPKPIAIVKPSGGAACDILGLKPWSCRWIDEDPLAGPARYCGEPRARGAYCAYHGAMAYVPVAERDKPIKTWLDGKREAA